MLTSKQRSYLRGLANTVDPILQVGKDGIGENLTKQVRDALEARELVKATVLKSAEKSTREISEEIAKQVNAEVVQVIGSKFVLYKESRKHKEINL